MGIDVVVERIVEGGNLLNNLDLLKDIMSWQTSQEVFAAWQAGASVEVVNTANMGIYRLVNGNVVFDFLGKEGNLFIDERFRKDAYNGIVGANFFFPRDEMKSHVLSAINKGESVQIDYSGLRLKTKGCGEDYSYVQVNDNNTSEEEKLIRGVYGTEHPGNGKKVYLLGKNVVKNQLQKRKNDFIARACYFYGNQSFNASVRYFGNYCSAVCGVRRGEVAEGDAKKSNPLADAYVIVLSGVNNLRGNQVLELYTALQQRVMGAASKQLQQ